MAANASPHRQLFRALYAVLHEKQRIFLLSTPESRSLPLHGPVLATTHSRFAASPQRAVTTAWPYPPCSPASHAGAPKRRSSPGARRSAAARGGTAAAGLPFSAGVCGAFAWRVTWLRCAECPLRQGRMGCLVVPSFGCWQG